jgi:hypothetical protein
LWKFLESRRIVTLAHDNSRIGELQNLSVDAVATLYALTRTALLGLPQPEEPPLPVEQILQLIRKDHDFHQSPSVHRHPGRAQA